MTTGGPAMAGASRTAEPAERVAEVSWFDTREVTLAPADLADLDPREAARAAAFVFPADRHRYQVAHVMLRRVLAGHLGTEPGRLRFGRQQCPACGGPSGKPVLAGSRAVPAWGDTAPSGGHPRTPDGPGTPRGVDGAWPASRQAPSRMAAEPGGPGDGAGPGLSFSLAHSGEAVAIAVARGPVGIDVEREATGCVCSLASAMHADDAALVEVLPEPERHLAVIRWWVRAEAVLKCAGTGIAHGMDAFPVLAAPVRRRVPPGPRLPWEPDVPGWAAAAGCSFAALSAPRGYQAALALPGLRLIRYRWGPDRR
jgi:phosphopantetheinyl transferase